MVFVSLVAIAVVVLVVVVLVVLVLLAGLGFELQIWTCMPSQN